jgi:hypothetical protein
MDIGSIIGSTIVGFVGGVAALWAQQHVQWKPQKRIEVRRAVFDQALDALARYEVDALDADFQKSERNKPGDHLKVAIRVETRVLMQRARLQVEAFFPKATSDEYKAALHAIVSLDTIPNTQFTERSVAAIKMMAADIGLKEDTGISGQIANIFSKSSKGAR